LIAFSGSAIRYRKVRCEADFVKVLRYVVLLLLVGLSTAAPTCAETSIYFRGRPLFVPASIVLLVVGIALVALGVGSGICVVPEVKRFEIERMGDWAAIAREHLTRVTRYQSAPTS